jgi:hypothetical protein
MLSAGASSALDATSATTKSLLNDPFHPLPARRSILGRWVIRGLPRVIWRRAACNLVTCRVYFMRLTVLAKKSKNILAFV